MKTFKVIMRIIYIATLLFFYNINILAIETIVINKGNFSALPIAINNFESDNNDNAVIGDNIINIISNDLKSCGLFKPISHSAFIEYKTGILHKPLFSAWRQISAGLLLNGHITQISNDKIKVSVILWDTVLEKMMLSEHFEFNNKKLYRRIAHKIADKIYERITGDPGYFDTKIAYVAEEGTRLKRVKRIAIMDYDGANNVYLTDGRNLVLTPRLSPNNDRILYISYANKVPRVYLYDFKTSREKIVGDFPGMSFAPRFSKHGDKALMSIAKNGDTHIFEINFKNMKMQQLTFGPSINTSPSYSPDDKQIVFNSDRSGTRQLYIMNVDGSNVRRISFGEGTYATPVWSPRGDYIAFTKITKDLGFSIGIMKPIPDDSAMNDERIIATGYLVEGPTWSPNGRSIIFAKSEPPRGNTAGKSRLYCVDLTGYNERQIETVKDASDPDWSTLLK